MTMAWLPDRCDGESTRTAACRRRGLERRTSSAEPAQAATETIRQERAGRVPVSQPSVMTRTAASTSDTESALPVDTTITERAAARAEARDGTMQAIVQDHYGTDPEDTLRLAVMDKPTIGDDEVLVRVQAASVDRGTWHIMTGLPYPIRLAGFGLRKPKYLNPGRCLAGTIEAVGDNVTGFALADEVYGVGDGSFAEYVRARPGKS